jgi:CNT family concentrative nucleoside transporter
MKKHAMKRSIMLLVVITGIFFLQPLAAHAGETMFAAADAVAQQTDTSNILLAKERQTPFSIMTLFRGLLGMMVLVFVGYIFSSDRRNIPWRTVGIGLGMQILLALGVLYVPIVQTGFEFFGKIFVKVLDFTKEGSTFLLGDLMNADTYGYIFLFGLNQFVILLGNYPENCVRTGVGFYKSVADFGSRSPFGSREYFSGANRIAADD